MAHFVITGANRGIGLALVQNLTSRGDTVTALCRSASDDLRQIGADIHENIDVTDDQSVAGLTDKFAGQSIDVILNNAGILEREVTGSFNFDVIRQQMEVNTYGPMRVTQALLPSMSQGGKVAIVSSRVGSMGDNGSGGLYGYRMSKAAVNMAGVNLAHQLKPQGIAVVLLHPGYVKTDMTRGSGAVPPEFAAAGLIARIDDLTMETTGTFWHAEGEQLPW